MDKELKQLEPRGKDPEAYNHWKWQRITGIALFFLYLWFIYMIFVFLIKPEEAISTILYSPMPLILFLVLITVSIYHGFLGFRIICEDYIGHKTTRNTIIIIAYFISFFTVFCAIFMLFANFITNI